MKLSETKKNITDIINDYSYEYKILPQFVEKDYYVVKLLEELSKIEYPGVKIVFSGGTCLSKAYNKIKRFSEDIDFRLHVEQQLSRNERKAFCDFILEKLSKNTEYVLVPESILKGNENKFLSFELRYEKIYDTPVNLRPNIKIEFTFENIVKPSTNCEVCSFISPYVGENAVRIDCVESLEIIANKFSALMWRVLVKDRTKPLHTRENDPTIVRHLYDIASFETSLYNEDFKQLLTISFENDRGRGGVSVEYSLKEFAEITLDKLTNDNQYRVEYSDFVKSMCYSIVSDTIPFGQALEAFERLVKFI